MKIITQLPTLLHLRQSCDHLTEICQHLSLSPSKLQLDPDIHVLNSEESIKIEQVRTLISQLVFAPTHSPLSTWIILHIDEASIPAQSALLKTLEEPPLFVQIILTAQDIQRVLPTIRSRCLVKNSSTPKNHISSNQAEELPDFTKFSLSQAIDLAEANADRQTAINFLENCSLKYHQELSNNPNAILIYRLQLCQNTLKLLRKNINVKLALEDCFFAQIRL